MLVIGSLRIVILLFSLSLGALASRSHTASNELSNAAHDHQRELVKSIDSLNWLTRLFQYWSQLPFKLGPDYAELLTGLGNYYKLDSDIKEEYVNKTASELFDHIMKSNSSAGKRAVLKAIDPFLNDATVAYLVDSAFKNVQEPSTLSKDSFSKNDKKIIKKPHKKKIKRKLNSVCLKFENLSSAIQQLTIEEIKPIKKDGNNAKILSSSKYKLTGNSTTDPSIWFLLTQLELYPTSLWRFTRETKYIVSGIIKCSIALRADVDIKYLLASLRKAGVGNGWILRWHSYMTEKSPFKDTQLYNTKKTWELIGESLLLEEPKSIARTLDVNLQTYYRGTHSYLLLLADNPTRRFTNCKPNDIDGMYVCFFLISDTKPEQIDVTNIREMPKERLAEMAERLAELKSSNGCFLTLDTQLRLCYSSHLSLLGNDSLEFNADYARTITQLPKTLELLDVLGDAKFSPSWFDEKSFNRYLLENPNWNKAAGEHFHYFISFIMMENRSRMSKRLVEYMEADVYRALSMFKDQHQSCVDCTLDKIPHQLNDYFEIIKRQAQGNFINPSKYLGIAIRGSLFNYKAAKEDFVYYQLKDLQLLENDLQSPIFVDLVRMRYKYNDHDIREIKSFLYFEDLVYKHFSGSVRMDLERGFQRLQAANSLSAALKTVINKNFNRHELPFALKGLQDFEKNVFKYNPGMAVDLQVSKMPRMMILKAIYTILGHHSPDLNFTFVKHLFNAQLLHRGLA